MHQIKDYPYAINEAGEVFSLRYNPPRKLSGGLDTKGYKQYCLYLGDGSQVTVQAHRLVAEYYIPNLSNLPQVNHINEDRSDPRKENLEWCTGQYNVDYSQSKKYRLTHKDGTVTEIRNLNEFARSLGKTNAGNFGLLLSGKIKSCYGYVNIEEITE